MQCVKPIPAGEREHAGQHIHSLDPSPFHFCETRYEVEAQIPAFVKHFDAGVEIVDISVLCLGVRIVAHFTASSDLTIDTQNTPNRSMKQAMVPCPEQDGLLTALTEL